MLNARSLHIQLSICSALILAPFVAHGQELGDPLIGSEIIPNTVQVVNNSSTICALQEAGDVFCWVREPFFLSTATDEESSLVDPVGFPKLNAALNNDIGSITLSDTHLCGIGRVSGVACVTSDPADLNVTSLIELPPEPDASYLSISDIEPLPANANVCAIQTDNRVVCWGSNSLINDIPPEAAFLKQVDVISSRHGACGINLNNTLFCWGSTESGSRDFDILIGNSDDIATRELKQISFLAEGLLQACVINMDDTLECFTAFGDGDNDFTDLLADKSFSSIDLGRFTNQTTLCFETTSGETGCEKTVFSGAIGSKILESLLSPEEDDARLISLNTPICFITADEAMKCRTPSGSSSGKNQFPPAPQDLSFALFSETAGELTWARPVSLFTDVSATGFEIFRDGVFIERIPLVTSYFDSTTNSNANYEVRATRNLIAGGSSFVNADSSNGPNLPTEPSPPIETPTNTDDGLGALELTGIVYSSSALELFYNQSRAGSSSLMYNIFRDGELLRGNSLATSQGDGGLDANTTYFYAVEAVLDGNIISTDNITLTTNDDGRTATPSMPVNNPASPTVPTTPSGVTVALSGAVYSSSALELFWNRASVPGVTYNIFRDGVLTRENSPATSQFNGGLPPNNTFVYEVVALLDGVSVASSTIEINTSTGLVSEPVASGPQQSTVASIGLTGAVFSSSALELSWNRDDIPGVTYDIFRDDELIRENSPAISQFDSGLLPNTTYSYTVTPRLNGVEQVSETIVLSTRSI